MSKYPKFTKDKKGRICLTRISESKATIKKYWEDTNQIKVFYVIRGDLENPKEITVDIIDKKGNILMNYSNFFGLKIKMSGFRGFNIARKEDIKFPVSKEKITNWLKKNK